MRSTIAVVAFSGAVSVMTFGAARLQIGHAGGSADAAGVRVTTVYLVRHAEKTSEQADELSADGKARAETLAWMLRDVPLNAIYSTPFRRTRDTVQPLAGAKKVKVQPYENAGALAKQIRGGDAGGAVLVVGHSNTVPETISALGGSGVTGLLEGYDDLFVVTVVQIAGGETSAVQVHRLRYGARGA